jgi:PAS domain S-box-containing protein
MEIETTSELTAAAFAPVPFGYVPADCPRRRLLDHFPGIAYEVVPGSWQVLSIHGTIEEMTGYTPEDLEAGRPRWDTLILAEDLPLVARLGEQLRDGEIDQADETYRIRRRDGSICWVRDIARLWREEGGTTIFGSLQDVTAHRAALDRLRESEERCCKLSRAVEQSPSAVVITDPEGTIEYVNPRFTESTGYTAEEAIGSNPRLLKSGETPPETYRDLWRTIAAGREWRGELVNRRKNGDLLWVEASISALVDGDGRVTHYVAVEEDVTERKRAERVLDETQQRFLQAQKMEAVGRLAGGVAHDFNNLLTVITGYGELVANGLGENEPHRAGLEAILAAARRASQLTRQLLAFSRRQVLQPKVIDIGAALADMQKMLHRLIGEDVELVVRVAGDLGAVKVDVGQLEQVILNLAVNARDAMPAGGRLAIEAANRELDGLTPTVRGELHPGRWVAVRVSDTGEGMDESVKSRLFEPFFTTKPVGQGTGLGLATVYGIVTQSGGFMDVESAPAAGSTFSVYLPRIDEAVEREAAAPVAVHDLCGSETLLVVEDQENLRQLLCLSLRQLGYMVLEAASGAAALAVVEERPVDLLLTDVVMPGISGRELAAHVVQRRPGTPVLFMSGYTSDVISRHGMLTPKVQLIEKPFTAQELAQRVRQLLGGAAAPAERVR